MTPQPDCASCKVISTAALCGTSGYLFWCARRYPKHAVFTTLAGLCKTALNLVLTLCFDRHGLIRGLQLDNANTGTVKGQG